MKYVYFYDVSLVDMIILHSASVMGIAGLLWGVIGPWPPRKVRKR